MYILMTLGSVDKLQPSAASGSRRFLEFNQTNGPRTVFYIVNKYSRPTYLILLKCRYFIVKWANSVEQSARQQSISEHARPAAEAYLFEQRWTSSDAAVAFLRFWRRQMPWVTFLHKLKSKCSDLKCVRKPTRSRLSLTHHANKSSRWAE